MQRLLLGFVFGFVLLAAGAASALVITSGKTPLLHHEGRPDNIVVGFGGSVQPPEIQLLPWLHPTELPRVRPPFEWPRFARQSEPDSWKGKFPFFSHFPLSRLIELHRQRHDDSAGSPVPEPTTALLFGAGLLGLGLIRRRGR